MRLATAAAGSARHVLALALISSGSGNATCLPQLPEGFPEPDIGYQTGLPATDRQTDTARTKLGERLFSDVRLSVSGTHSCASCHDPEHAFTDGAERSVGAQGDRLPHNAPTLWNAALKYRFNWRADGPERLLDQHRQPLTRQTPVELGFGAAQLAVLNADPDLRAQLALARLPETTAAEQTFTTGRLLMLLARFVASLRCATRFDAFNLGGDAQAISASAKRGLRLFVSARLGCSGCHRGPLLGGGLRSVRGAFPATRHARARAAETVLLQTPSLRLVAHSAPYLFDGSVADLRTVIDQYASGRVSEVPGFALSDRDRTDLIAFLETL